MKLAHKKIEKIDQRLRIQPLRGGQPPLHYINEQFLDDTNDKTSFLYGNFIFGTKSVCMVSMTLVS